CLLLALVFQLAQIGDLAHRRLGVWGNLYEVQPGGLGGEQRIVDGDDTLVVAVCVDQLNVENPDIPVRARPVLGRRRGFEWSANGRALLMPLMTDARM